MSRIDDIRATWSKAEREARYADTLRWRVAEMVAAELADGKSQRQLAEEVRKSQTHIYRMNRMWTVYGATIKAREFPVRSDGEKISFSELENTIARARAESNPRGSGRKPQSDSKRSKTQTHTETPTDPFKAAIDALRAIQPHSLTGNQILELKVQMMRLGIVTEYHYAEPSSNLRDLFGKTPQAKRESLFKKMATVLHPDAGGTEDVFKDLETAYAPFKK